MQVKMRARRLVDPMNSHEWVEVEVVYEPDLVAGALRDAPRRVESSDEAERKCATLLIEALDHAEAVTRK